MSVRKLPTIPLPFIGRQSPSDEMKEVYTRFQEQMALNDDSKYFNIIKTMPDSLLYDVADHLTKAGPESP
jgi:hypothetical protein